MYCTKNFKTKTELKRAVQAYLQYKSARPMTVAAVMYPPAEPVTIFAPGLGTPAVNGVDFVEGPWYPEPHRWYAKVTMQNSIVVKVE